MRDKMDKTLSPEQISELEELLSNHFKFQHAKHVKNDLWNMLVYSMSNTETPMDSCEKQSIFCQYNLLVEFFDKLEEFRDSI